MTEAEKLEMYLAAKGEAEKIEIFYQNHPEIIFGALKRVKIDKTRREHDYRDWYQIAVVGFLDGYHSFPHEVKTLDDYQMLKNFAFRSAMWHLMRELEKLKKFISPMEEEKLHWWMDAASPNQSCVEIVSILEDLIPKLTVGEIQFLEGRLVHRLSIAEMAELYGVTKQMMYKRRSKLKKRYENLLED